MWDAACAISDSFGDTRCKRSIQLRVRVNGWLARKNRDGLSRVRDDIDAWDVSGLSKEFKMRKRALLDQLTEDELRTMIDEGSLTRFEVLTNPMFANIRQWITPAEAQSSDAPNSGNE